MLNNKWYQVWVKHLNGDSVARMQHCDEVLQRFTSVPCAPDGIPILEKDGTIEVRSYNEAGFRMAKRYLQDEGFEIVREQENG